MIGRNVCELSGAGGWSKPMKRRGMGGSETERSDGERSEAEGVAGKWKLPYYNSTSYPLAVKENLLKLKYRSYF